MNDGNVTSFSSRAEGQHGSAIYMRDRYPEIDMGTCLRIPKELPETYDFLNRLEAYLESRLSESPPTKASVGLIIG